MRALFILLALGGSALAQLDTFPPSQITGPNGAKVSVADGNASITAGSGGAVNVTNGDVYVPTIQVFSTSVTPTLSGAGQAALAFNGTDVLVSRNGGVYAALGGGTTLTDSASLRSALSDEIGTGAAVFNGANVSFGTGAFTTLSASGAAVLGNGSTLGGALYADGNVRLASSAQLGWTSGASNGTQDTILLRDAANTLALRNGVNAQTLNLYRTYTDASNYSRVTLSTGAYVNLAPEYAGTGTSSGMLLQGRKDTSGAAQILLGANGNIDFGQYLVRTAWSITPSGHFVTSTDNTYDIGASGATRPRAGYFGTSVRSPKFETAASVQWTSGAGTPEGAVTANVGSLYTRTDGGAATTLYVKETGTGNVGWVAK